MSNRISVDDYFMTMVEVVSLRGSCVRRKTGAIAVNELNHILSTGYNGRPMGFVECVDSPCEGAYAPSGSDLHKCEAVHAEQNALLQCPDVLSIDTMYCTTQPCIHCMKLICNTSCKRVVFKDEYPHPEVKALAKKAGITLVKWS